MTWVRLVVVYKNSIMADGAPLIEFKRSDTGAKVSCVDCAFFTSKAECSRKLAHPWPLGSVCCTAWQLREVPHEMKPCAECGKPMPQYYTNRARCGSLCEMAEYTRRLLAQMPTGQKGAP